ncbi:putative transcription factor bHLH family [Dioscorea sansibarensis]
MPESLSDLFNDSQDFSSGGLSGAASPENLFTMLENLDDYYANTKDSTTLFPFTPFEDTDLSSPTTDPDHEPPSQASNKAGNIRSLQVPETEEDEASLARKKLKFSNTVTVDGMNRMSHITVERNRRKQMNDNLSVLRSLMPCFYVKRGDQASIIGGVVDYIKELQQVLQSLEAKKQRKVYNEVLSPRPVSSPRPSQLSPRPPPPVSPRVSLPISPRTPQPTSPYKPRMQYSCLNPTLVFPSLDSSSSLEPSLELAANSKSPVADVEVKFSGPNVLLKTVSHRIPGQPLKIITALEGLALEILHVSISAIDDHTMLNSFTIKIGIECELSAEELAQEIQQTFSQN